MDDRGSQGVGRWSWLGWVVSLLALGFVVRWLVRVDHAVWRNLLHFRWPWLALSLGFFLLWFILRYWIWEFIIHRHGYGQDRGQNLRMWTTSELLRYIPGNVWSFAGRYRGARQGGVERASTIQAIVLEAAGLLTGAGVVSLLTFSSPWRWTAPVIYLVAIAAGPQVIRWVLVKFKQQVAIMSRFEALMIISGYVVVWIVFGLAHMALFRAMQDTIGIVSWWLPITVSVFSWFIGYVTLITPMGLGVREATFANTLAAGSSLTIATAGLVALVSRVWMVLSELIFLGFVMVFSRLA